MVADVQEYGDGEPLLIINGTSQSLGFWADTTAVWSKHYRVISYDLRGVGASERGSGGISVASLAEDARGLLEALSVARERTAVADAVPGAQHHLITGTASSHALGVERAEEYLPLALAFLTQHSFTQA